MMQAISKQRVLNVDDNDAARYTKSRILKRAGFNVLEAATGTEALAIIRETCPDLVLLDVQLPDINGFEVCQLIKKDPATNKVLVLQTSASYVAMADKIRALEEGADNYLFEPIEPEELIANVKALLRLAQAERELREVNQRKDEFIAMLAHELRNPLGPIRNSVELMRQREEGLSESQKNAREMIGRQADHMVRLVNDLLDVSRVSRGKITLQMEPVEIHSVIQQAIDNIAPIIHERQQQLQSDLPKEAIWVMGDHVRLVQIISNLLHNAAKFTRDKGHLMIGVRVAAGNVNITVQDDGIGIPAHHIDQIFELFSQAHPATEGGKGGLGIGLSLVRNLTELHDGEIKVHSEGVGHGSTFSLSFRTIDAPVGSAQTDSQNKEDVSSEPVTSCVNQNSKVLIVDDNVDAAEILRTLLEINNYSVQTSHCGKDALESIQQQLPQIVVLDIGLPDINGRELASRIRGIPGMKEALLIALSGFGQQKDIDESLQAGMDVHLTKPVAYETLLSAFQHRRVM